MLVLGFRGKGGINSGPCMDLGLSSEQVVLFAALIAHESGFNPRCVSGKNSDGSVDLGLCQLNSYTFGDIKGFDPFDPEQNIKYGIDHFLLRWAQAEKWVRAKGISKSQIADYALLGYNRGPGFRTDWPRKYVNSVRQMIPKLCATVAVPSSSCWVPLC